MTSRIKKRIVTFVKSSKQYPVLTALAAGLYPFLYNYNANFTLVNSWEQFLFFIFFYLFLPAILFLILFRLFKRIGFLAPYNKYLLAILNFSCFAALIIISTVGFKKKLLALVLLGTFCLAVLLYRHIKKIVVLQYILALVILIELIPYIYKASTYSLDWMEQPDVIEQVVFKKRPNIYLIQPDGYANFSELKKENYNYDNSSFEQYLKENQFKLYESFRSNYTNTVTSNSSMFSMKHHYYYNPTKNTTEAHRSRTIIAGDNPVVSIFKNNTYKTFLMLEKPYLLVNRPQIKYNYCNIDYSEVSLFSRGFSFSKDILPELESLIVENSNTNNFFFIEKISPGHISVLKSASRGKIKEREHYIGELEKTNIWLQNVIDLIIEKDKNSLIIIAADHGGYVGMNYTAERHTKLTNPDLIHSIFTAALAIKWPDEPPSFDTELKSNVNLFRILFSYLSDEEKYLQHLEEDSSYLIIHEGAPPGSYEVIDDTGNNVFNKHLQD